jgi:hypothetical protein
MSSSEAVGMHEDLAQRAAEIRGVVDGMLAAGEADLVPDAAVQQLLTAAVRLYAAKEGPRPRAFAEGEEVTATEVLVTVSEMLEAVDVEVFELGIWQAWGSSS